MFSKYVECKVVNMAIAYPLPTENLEWPNMPKEHVKIHSTDPTSSQPTNPTSSQPTEPTSTEPTESTTTYPDDDKYLANSEPQNELVGVDDEGLYLQIAPQLGLLLRATPLSLSLILIPTKTMRKRTIWLEGILYHLLLLLMISVGYQNT
jgi:hypothetical protein